MLVWVALVLSCCKRDNKVKSDTRHFNTRLTTQELDYIMMLPDGTTYEYALHTEAGDTAMRFTLPDRWRLMGIKDDDTYDTLLQGGIRCACKTNGGCSPVNYGSSFGCINETCNACVGTLTTIDLEYLDDDYKFTDVALVNLAAPFLTVNAVQDLLGKQLFSYPVTKVPGFDAIMNELYTYIYEGVENIPAFITNHETPPASGYKYIAVLLWGTVAFIPVPESDFDDSSPFLPNYAGHTCTCYKGTGGCTPETRFGIKACRAGSCSDCALSGVTIRVRDGENFLDYELVLNNGFVTDLVQQ